MSYPESMTELIEEFSRLPGVGRRTAERFAFYVLRATPDTISRLSELLVKVNENIHACERCYNFSEGPVCGICLDPSRDHSVICVVQEPKDVIAVEKAGDYNGVYHVLMGVLSPLEGIGPRDIKIRELFERLTRDKISEVILATSSDTEGDATSNYLAKQLNIFSAKGGKVKVTRLAHGVPVGSALEFVDKASLSRAIRARQPI
jgi:recombination protein RecR